MVVFVSQAIQDADPDGDHVEAGQGMQSVLFAFEKVPAVQLMQLFMVSGTE